MFITTYLNFCSFVRGGGSHDFLEPLASCACSEFNQLEFVYGVDVTDIISPPCLMDQVLNDPDFEPLPGCNMFEGTDSCIRKHVAAVHCVRSLHKRSVLAAILKTICMTTCYQFRTKVQ